MVEPAAKLYFDKVEHEYRLFGQRLPSVTEVLGAQGMLPDYSWMPEFYRERGSAVHSAIALEFFDRLDWGSLDENTKPYVERFRTFIEHLDFEPILVEQPLASEVYLYAGTPDALGWTGGGELLFLDWKCGGIEPAHHVQLAGGYMPLLEEAADEGRIPVTREDLAKARMAVVSLANDNPKLHPVERNGHRDVFRSALATYRWRLTHMKGVRDEL